MCSVLSLDGHISHGVCTLSQLPIARLCTYLALCCSCNSHRFRSEGDECLLASCIHITFLPCGYAVIHFASLLVVYFVSAWGLPHVYVLITISGKAEADLLLIINSDIVTFVDIMF
jgi:hypothetical protein